MEKELELKEISSTQKPTYEAYNGTVDDLVEKYANVGNFNVVAFLVDKVMIGKVEQGKLVFADEEDLNEKYLKEIRIFNTDKEVLLKKTGKLMKLRVIEDHKTGEGYDKVICVDDCSKFFGAAYAYKNGFVTLVEENRKICLKVPSDRAVERFLHTRSYVVSDENTGLSGYDYYRYLDITD